MDLLVVKKKRRSSTEVLKETIRQQYASKEKEAIMRQRKYLKTLSNKVDTRTQTIMNASCENANSQLQNEMNILKKKIWVASGRDHQLRFESSFRQIHCHIQCQARMNKHIRELKTSIQNAQREIGRVTRQIYVLNRQTVPETLHQYHVAKARKQMQMLGNRLEIGMRRECDFTAKNAALRNELVGILKDRADFNVLYTKMVNRLNYEKRYLTDLVEYALSNFERCIEVYEKMDALQKRQHKEEETHKMEMQFLIRDIESELEIADFNNSASKRRNLSPLEPKEYDRRELFRVQYMKKINLYNDTLAKILNYTKSHNVSAVINKFQEQESCYYSYFNYSNEMGYHITLLQNAVNRLYTDIDGLKQKSRSSVQEQLQTIADLEQKLVEKKANNEELKRKSDNNDIRIEKLLNGIQLLLDQCRVKPQKIHLGNFNAITLSNIRYYLKLIQQRVIEIVAATYIMERMDETKTYTDYIVKDIEKICESPTDLDEIVLTQQCPECAEGDAHNVDDIGEGGPTVLSLDSVKRKIYERVQQPEMQYRLHSVSQCRLPRSRLISAKNTISQIFG